MACTIKFKGKTYTESEFREFVANNISEIRDVVSDKLKENLTDLYRLEEIPAESSFKSKTDRLAEDLIDKVSTSLSNAITEKYGVEKGSNLFKSALSNEIHNFLSGNKYLKGVENFGEFIREANSYKNNIPNVKSDEVTFYNDKTKKWDIYNKQEFFNDLLSGKEQIGEDIDKLHFAIDYDIRQREEAIEANYSNKAFVDRSKILTDPQKKVLSNRFDAILNRLGFRVMGMEEYRNNYRAKNGVPLGAKGLADISNRIIAIADGVDINEVLNEELSHVLVEAYADQATINEILPEVENTDMWQQHSAKYYEIYSKEKGISPEKLTEKVRREILGKIIAEEIAKTEKTVPTTLWGKISNWLSDVSSYLKTVVKGNTKTELQKLTEKIANSINEESKMNELYNSDNLNSSPFDVFYALGDDLIMSLLKFKDHVRAITPRDKNVIRNEFDRLTRKIGTGNLSPVELLEAASIAINIASQLNKNVRQRIHSVQDAMANGRDVVPEMDTLHSANAHLLLDTVLPELAALKGQIAMLSDTNNSQFEALKQRVLQDFEMMNKMTIDNLGDYKALQRSTSDNYIQSIVKKLGLSQETVSQAKNYLNTKTRQIRWLTQWFGHMMNNPNMLINFLGRISSDIHHNTGKSTKQSFDVLMNRLKALNLDNAAERAVMDNVIIEKDASGNPTGYFISPFDFASSFKEYDETRIREYNNALAKDFPQLKPITQISEIGVSHPPFDEFSVDTRLELEDKLRTKREELFEQPTTVTLKDIQNKAIDEIRKNGVTIEYVNENGQTVTETMNNVSIDTVEFLFNISSRRNEILNKYRQNGIVDYNALSDMEKQELASIERERKLAMSTIDATTGMMKTGTELQIAKELLALRNHRINTANSSGSTVKQDFYNELNNIADNQQALDWFMDNAGFKLKQDFWTDFNNQTIDMFNEVKKVINASNSNPQAIQDALDQVDELKALTKKKSEILKHFKDASNPMEVDVSSMGDYHKSTLLDLEEDIQRLYNNLNIFYKGITNRPIPTIFPENTNNEAYKKDLAESGLDEMKFLERNSTKNNNALVRNFERVLRDAVNNRTVPTSSSFLNQARVALGLPANTPLTAVEQHLRSVLTQANIVENLTLAYARTKVSSIYMRFAPKGYSNFITDLKNGNLRDATGQKIGIKEVVDAMSNPNSTVALNPEIKKYVEINPRYTWLNQDFYDANGNKIDINNPNYIQTNNASTFYGGYGQPKRLNHKFIQDYQIDMDHLYKTGQMRPVAGHSLSSDRLRQLEYLNLMIEMRHEGITRQNVNGTMHGNAYTIPQIRKTSLQHMNSFLSNPIDTIRNVAEDTFVNVADAKAYGQTISSDFNLNPNADNLVVPVVGVTKLERMSDVSTDLLYSTIAHQYESHLYEERSKALPKVNALEAMLKEKDFENGLKGENTRDYKMFKEQKNSIIYGVKDNQAITVNLFGKKRDLTKIVRKVGRFIGFANLGFNPSVSITAMTSANVFALTEAVYGQYSTKSSMKKGYGRFMTGMKDYALETGKVNRKSEIYVLGELYGIIGSKERAMDSTSNAVMKTLFRDGIEGIGHGLTEILTKPFGPSLMYSVMDNNRFALNPNTGNIELFNFDRFRMVNEKLGKTKQEIKDSWKQLENNSVLANTVVKDGKIEYTQHFQDLFKQIDDTNPAEVQNAMELMVRGQLDHLVAAVEAKVPESDKSAATRNAIATGVLQHRTWAALFWELRFKSKHFNASTGMWETGMYNALAGIASKMYDSYKNQQSFADAWNNLTDFERQAVKRVAYDTAITLTLLAIYLMAVKPAMEDDKNKDNFAVQYLGYMFLRLQAEQASSGILGVKESLDVLESPMMAIKTVKMWAEPSSYSSDIVEKGAYKGYTKFQRTVLKSLPIKHYIQLNNDLDGAIKNHINRNSWTLPFAKPLTEEEKKQLKFENLGLDYPTIPEVESLTE